jgi:hypothetical protein
MRFFTLIKPRGVDSLGATDVCAYVQESRVNSSFKIGTLWLVECGRNTAGRDDVSQQGEPRLAHRTCCLPVVEVRCSDPDPKPDGSG